MRARELWPAQLRVKRRRAHVRKGCREPRSVMLERTKFMTTAATLHSIGKTNNESSSGAAEALRPVRAFA